MDRSVAAKSGVGLGDEVEILGEEFEVIGLSEETSSLTNSIAFISSEDFETMRQSYDTFSFLLVNVRNGESPEVVADRIDDRSGWIAFQFQNSSQAGTSLVYVYRRLDGVSSKSLHLQEIDKTQTYTVAIIDASDSPQPGV